MVVQACMHVVIMVNSNAIYNDDVSVAMIHVLPNNFGLSSCWQNVSLFLLPVACFMEDIWYALSGGSAVCVPIRWSPFSGMLHGISTVFCTTHHTIMTIWIRQQTVDLRSMYLTAVWLCVPGLLCPWDINCGLPHCLLSHDYHHWTTVDYLTVVCFFLMDSLSAMNYQLWITSLRSAFSWWILSLPWIINCGLPRHGLLSRDGFTLCHNYYQLCYGKIKIPPGSFWIEFLNI